MSEQKEDVGRWIQDLTTRAVQEQMRALQRYQELMQRVMRGELDEQTLREEYMSFAQEETSRYARHLATLSLSYYNALADLNRTYNDRFFERVMSSHDDEGAQSRVPPQQVEMELGAPIGQVATGAFVLENKRTATAEISFLVSEFDGPEGTAPFRPPLQIRPPRFTLAPNEEQPVSLHLPLLPDLFAPGQLYTASVVVRGYDDLELRLKVRPETATSAANSGVTQAAGVSIRPAPAPETVVRDDLTTILGIGPKFAERLSEAGITSFADLAAAEEPLLLEALGKTAVRWAKRQQWREQARLAAAGDTTVLAQLQQELARRKSS